MKVIENAQLNSLIQLFNYHMDKVEEYSSKQKYFDLRTFYNYLPRSFKNDKTFFKLHILMHLANEIEKNNNLSQNDFETLQNNFWSPMSKILLQANEK